MGVGVIEIEEDGVGGGAELEVTAGIVEALGETADDLGCTGGLAEEIGIGSDDEAGSGGEGGAGWKGEIPFTGEAPAGEILGKGTGIEEFDELGVAAIGTGDGMIKDFGEDDSGTPAGGTGGFDLAGAVGSVAEGETGDVAGDGAPGIAGDDGVVADPVLGDDGDDEGGVGGAGEGLVVEEPLELEWSSAACEDGEGGGITGAGGERGGMGDDGGRGAGGGDGIAGAFEFGTEPGWIGGIPGVVDHELEGVEPIDESVVEGEGGGEP